MDGLTAKTASPSITESRNAVTTVVQAVADEKGVSPLELEPIANALDPDVIEKLVDDANAADSGSVPRIEFEYEDCEVTVTADGQVTVDERWRV